MFFGGGTVRFVAITDEGGRVFLQGLGSFFWDSQDVKKVSPLSGSPENVIRGPLDDDESLRCK